MTAIHRLVHAPSEHDESPWNWRYTARAGWPRPSTRACAAVVRSTRGRVRAKGQLHREAAEGERRLAKDGRRSLRVARQHVCQNIHDPCVRPRKAAGRTHLPAFAAATAERQPNTAHVFSPLERLALQLGLHPLLVPKRLHSGSMRGGRAHGSARGGRARAGRARAAGGAQNRRRSTSRASSDPPCTRTRCTN